VSGARPHSSTHENPREVHRTDLAAAQSTANEALAKANAAQNTATEALSKANAAQSTADQAMSTANSANQKAEEANEKVERMFKKAMMK
jgi:murein lipoprotein